MTTSNVRVQTDRQPAHPRLQELFAYLNLRRNALRDAMDAVPEPLRGQPPETGRWSVAEVLEHLALVEEQFTKVLGDRLAEARAAGIAPERATSPIVGTYDQNPVLDRTARREAPEVVRPQGVDWKSAWSHLEDARRSFLDLFLSADGLALGDVSYVHPRLGTLNLYQWGVWMGAHEGRHTEQVREIAATFEAD